IAGADRRARSPELLCLAFLVRVAGTNPDEQAVIVGLELRRSCLRAGWKSCCLLEEGKTVHRAKRRSGAAVRNRVSREAGAIELGGPGTRAIGDEPELPRELRPAKDLGLERCFYSVSFHSSGVLPLSRVAVETRQRNLNQLVGNLVLRVRQLHRISILHDHVETELGLRRQLGLERLVAKCVLHETTACGEVERLELVGKAGAASGRSARYAR